MKPIVADSSNFDTVVLAAERPVLVDFWATWCPPCRVLDPMLDRAADELGDRVSIARVDADTNSSLMRRYGVSSVPTLILFHAGEEVERRIGPNGLEPLRNRALALTN